MNFSPNKGEINVKCITDDSEKALTQKEWLALMSMGIISIILCVFFNMSGNINSDIVSYTMWGQDIASGNILLSHWIMPTNTFYFLSLLCALIGSLIGFNATLSSIVAALVYAFATMLTCFIILKFNKSHRIGRWLMVFFIFGMAVVPSDNLLGGLLGGAHVDITIFILFAFYLIYVAEQNYEKERWWKLCIAYILLAFGAFSDNLVLYYGIVPIFAVFALKYIFDRCNKSKRFFCTLNIILSIIAASISILTPKIIEKLGGFELAGYSKPSFVPVKDIGARIVGLFQDMISQFGADFSEINGVNFKSIITLCNLILFITMVILLIIHYKQKTNINTFTLFSICSISICFVMLIFMNYETIENIYTFYTIRLMRVQFFLILVLLGCVDVRTYVEKIHVNKVVQFIIIFGLLIVSLFARLDNISFNGKNENTFDKICKVLQENNLSTGFGTYWYSHAVTVTSVSKNVIYPISGEKPQRFRWISKKVPDDIYANFVILKDNDKEFGVTEQSLISSVGSAPVKTFHVDNVTIYVWNENIAPYFANLSDNSDVILNGSSMFGNPNSVVSDSSMVLNQGGIMYGPYFAAKKGNYHVDIHGINLDVANCDINSEEMNKNINVVYKIEKQTNNEVVIDFTVPKDITDLEIRAFNNTTNEQITVDRIDITR